MIAAKTGVQTSSFIESSSPGLSRHADRRTSLTHPLELAKIYLTFLHRKIGGSRRSPFKSMTDQLLQTKSHTYREPEEAQVTGPTLSSDLFLCTFVSGLVMLFYSINRSNLWFSAPYSTL
jgi:hypothetical protein